MNTRPVLHIPMTNVEKWHDVICIAVLIAAVGYPLFVWQQLPDTIPIHFSAGKANNWGSKSFIFLPAIINVLCYLGLRILRKYPHRFNYMVEITKENAHRQYVIGRILISWLKLLTVVLFAYTEWDMVQAGLNHVAP